MYLPSNRESYEFFDIRKVVVFINQISDYFSDFELKVNANVFLKRKLNN
jgi:hypothetical protein